ncbi:MAG: hypothetical protein WC749_15195, partial [Dehalococcoidia bacterium]
LGFNPKGRGSGYLNDLKIVLLLAATAILLYSALYYLTSRSLQRSFEILSNQSLRSTTAYLRLFQLADHLIKIIKALLIAILIIPILVSHAGHSIMNVVPLLLLLFAVALLYMKRSILRDSLIMSYIYLAGSFMIFVVENYGREDLLPGIALNHISHLLFFILLVSVGLKVFIRKRVAQLIVVPIEYLIMLIVLCVPMLPSDFTSSYHLMTVAAKSVVMFVGLKLILMHDDPLRNRKILLTVAVSSLVLAIRYAFGI